MTTQSSDMLVRMQQSVPSVLHDKLSTHYADWLQGCERENLPSDPGIELELLGKIWACSDFVALTSCRRPRLWFELLNNNDLQREFELADYQAELRRLFESPATIDDAALMQVLRLFRQKQMLRIAWRDLAGIAATSETLRNLTDLAEACVDLTLEFLYQDQCKQLGTPCNADGTEQRLIVLGMGKLGGHELNFSSDIDLIFAFPEEGETQGARSMANSQFFVRLAQRFIRVIDEKTADGFVFRVDMRLRPYGDSGPLVMSFAGMEHYYQTQGRDWERYAMIKARVIGGDREEGKEFMDMLRPFIYRRYLDFGAFESIRDMKAMIDAEVKRKGNKGNIKLGEGGIREIEFIGQTYQLIRGGGEKDLQVRGILRVLALLAKKGYMPESTTEELTESYNFLRRLENRLQMYADAQTHNLPVDARLQQSMSLAMDLASWDELEAATALHRQRVHGHFNEVFAIGENATVDEDAGTAVPWSALWRGELDEAFAIELLDNQGIEEAEELLRQLRLFHDSAQVQALNGIAAQRLETLMPQLLKQLATRKHVTSLVTRVLNLLQAILRRSVYLALLIEYPVAMDQVIRLCAASPWIASLLTRYPILLDELLDARALYAIPSQQQLTQELDDILAQAVDDEESQMELLRKFKQAHVLRIAAMDVEGALRVFEVSEQLTVLAEVLLAKTHELALAHLVKRHGKAQYLLDGQVYEPTMVIIAYGKMGGRELGYGSDLDLVFLHDSRGEQQQTDGDKCLDNSTFFARVAQRIVHILGTQTANGRIYEVDMRLRPDGASGMLVSNIAAFEQYQLEKAWTWEHQALVRARMVVGSTHIGEEFDRIRHSVLTRPRDLVRLQADVIEMRQKMRDALGSKQTDEFHLKQDAGGLVDIEFITQFCVLATASKYPELLKQTATRKFLQVLAELKCLDEAVVIKLSSIYEQYRVRSHQRALQEQASTLADSEFTSERAAVIEIWQKLLVQNPADSLGE